MRPLLAHHLHGRRAVAPNRPFRLVSSTLVHLVAHHRQQELVRGDGGVVDQHVEASRARRSSFRPSRRTRRRRARRPRALATVPGRPQLLDHGVAACCVAAVREVNGDARAGQALDDRLADTARAAGTIDHGRPLFGVGVHQRCENESGTGAESQVEVTSAKPPEIARPRRRSAGLAQPGVRSGRPAARAPARRPPAPPASGPAPRRRSVAEVALSAATGARWARVAEQREQRVGLGAIGLGLAVGARADQATSAGDSPATPSALSQARGARPSARAEAKWRAKRRHARAG